MSQDPKGFAAGDTNLYRYVGNDPTNSTDTSGLGKNWYPGKVEIGSGFKGPPGITYLPDDDGPASGLPTSGTQNAVDAPSSRESGS